MANFDRIRKPPYEATSTRARGRIKEGIGLRTTAPMWGEQPQPNLKGQEHCQVSAQCMGVVCAVWELRKHSKNKTHVKDISRALKRTPGALRQKGRESGNSAWPSAALKQEMILSHQPNR